MRNRLVAALCLAAALFWPQARALAQEEADSQGQEGEEQQEGGETEGADVTDQGQIRPGKQQQGKESAPGEVHTVVKGDTLWDLSQQYLGNAWYWPKVWSYNPEIANPHWIYPGNEVRFFPGQEDAPTSADPTEQTPQVTDVQPASDLNPDEGTEFVEDTSGDEIQVVGQIGRAPPKAVFILRNTFVTPREIEEAGKVVGSFAEKLMLSAPDEMYVKFRSAEARVGDRYMIFKTERGIDHPRRFGRYGYLTRVLGTARVVKAGPIATLRIEDTWDEIHRGDLVGPYGENLLATVAPRPADKTVEGYVIATTSPNYSIGAETYMMVVDKGSADGVQPGNEFIVMRQGDFGGELMNPSKTGNRDFPWEDIAVCMAVDVKEIASTCLLTKSLREVVPGDRVQVRASQASAVSNR